jgi:glycosyltransferase A (GT-A) superfamily protein (DUF2064 family)
MSNTKVNVQQDVSQHSDDSPPVAIIAVIAKCPIAGQSKTRLESLFKSLESSDAQQVASSIGAATIAQAMLSDVLHSISDCCRAARNYCKNNSKRNSNLIIDQLLFYSPPTPDGYRKMQSIVATVSADDEGKTLKDEWNLLPMDYTDYNQRDCNSKNKSCSDKVDDTSTTAATTSAFQHVQTTSNNLSNILSNAVRTCKDRYPNQSTTVILFGMDAPELPIEELYILLLTIQQTPKQLQNTALICPAYDGGYVMLSVPPDITIDSRKINTIFQSVYPYWSHLLTAIVQIKALSDNGTKTIIGTLVHDIDTPNDIYELIQRLQQDTKDNDNAVKSIEEKDDVGSISNDMLSRNDGNVFYISRPQPSALIRAWMNQNHNKDQVLPKFIDKCHYTRQALIELNLYEEQSSKSNK